MTLVELMISMLILALVCTAWLEIIGIQSARKEARRREAVERLAGMMDAFLYDKMSVSVSKALSGCYYMKQNGNTLSFIQGNENDVYKLFDGEISPIGYQLVVGDTNLPEVNDSQGWGSKAFWLVGRLYNLNGEARDAGKPFFTLPVCLGLAGR